MQNGADVAIIIKSDLADAVAFDEAPARRTIQEVHPLMEVFKLAAKIGKGMTEYIEFLERRHTRSGAAAV